MRFTNLVNLKVNLMDNHGALLGVILEISSEEQLIGVNPVLLY